MSRAVSLKDGNVALPRIGSAGLVTDDQHRILLGQRKKEPNYGKWVLPGGKIEPYESVTAAVCREIAEETGLVVEVTARAGVFEIIRPPDEHRVIVYSWARPVGGELRAGSDLLDLRYVSREECRSLDISDFVLQVLYAVGWLRRESIPVETTSRLPFYSAASWLKAATRTARVHLARVQQQVYLRPAHKPGVRINHHDVPVVQGVARMLYANHSRHASFAGDKHEMAESASNVGHERAGMV